MYYNVPMAIDAIRLTGPSVEETVSNVVDYIKAGAGGWSHKRAAGYMRKAFDGASDREGLIKACRGDGRKPFVDNAKILEAALPTIIGRRARSFNFPRTKVVITPEIVCAIGPAFFIVEHGVVRLVYLHARNEGRATLSHLASLAELVKREILDNDFYGQPGEIELHYIDKKGSARTDQTFDLAGLAKHRSRPIDQVLMRFAEAFRIVDDQRLAGPKPTRQPRAPEADVSQSKFDF